MLDPQIRDFAREKNFAALTVLLPSGHPMTHVMWVDADDEHVLINSELGRTKVDAVERDPRVTVTIWDRENPYRYAEVRGRVVATTTGDEAAAHIDALSEKYTGGPYASGPTDRRVILRIEPLRQHLR